MFASFEDDIRGGFLEVHPVVDQHLVRGLGLIARFGRYLLRTLDPMHLAITQVIDARQLATADRTMADVGKAIGLRIARFY